MGTINSSDRIAATLYSLGTFCLRNICVNTLHKGDSDDDDDDNNNNKSNITIIKPHTKTVTLMYLSSRNLS
jgi:hypothetical protein